MIGLFNRLDRGVLTQKRIIQLLIVLVLIIEAIIYFFSASASMNEVFKNLGWSLFGFGFMLCGAFLVLKVPGTIKSQRIVANLFFYFFSFWFVLS